ncbi:uncharacterized protein [Hyperolius riggenbachi]|uniref:uncharacterized protein isoform X2 n=1 Tax=Hyperolius riggenbachi TaxID=752182 RepID=UPI0035A3D008
MSPNFPMMRVFKTICLLVLALAGADALMVTTKSSPVSVLRWQMATIRCNITGLDANKPLAVDWKRKVVNGIEEDVYVYENGHIRVYRQGSYMEGDILEGNAALHIPRVEFSDEGEYTCIVTNTPYQASDKTSLQVSVIPTCTVSGDTSIELGTEKTVMCEVHNFYPKEIRIHWKVDRKGSSNPAYLPVWYSEDSMVLNPDGTFSFKTQRTLKPSREDDGDIYSCVVNHRSLQSDIAKNFTLTVTERKDHTVTIVGVMIGILLLVGALVMIYWKKCPTLSDITGDGELIHMRRTTLMFQIKNYRPDDIKVSVCLRRRDQEEVNIRDGECVILDVEEHMLVNGAATQDEGPLQLEVDFVPMRSRLGFFSCQYFLHITPSYDLDNGAELSIHVTHPALTLPISVRRTLNVIGVPPRLSAIKATDHQIHENVTFICAINNFKPGPLSIMWLRRGKDSQETVLITWPSETQEQQHNEKYSHQLIEDDHDSSYYYSSALTFKSTVKDDGVTYICRTFHPATQQQAQKELTMRLIGGSDGGDGTTFTFQPGD